MKNIEFLKLEVNKELSGVLEGFGKNRFGIFLILKNGKKMNGINLKPVVLRNTIKNNLELFEKGANIRITKLDKAKNKSYYGYEVYVNDKQVLSNSYDLSIDDLKILL